MIILGIDPGTTRLGFGVISKEGGILRYIASGVIGVNKTDVYSKLKKIEEDLGGVIKKYRPVVCGVEKLFFAKNTKTALAVSEARGVIVLVVGNNKIPIEEYTPNEIKSAVAGYGNADKKVIEKMVGLILKDKNIRGLDDVFDALAIAIRVSFDIK